ncbi:unnamed protein product, partial [Callosobruchus maculatus]
VNISCDTLCQSQIYVNFQNRSPSNLFFVFIFKHIFVYFRGYKMANKKCMKHIFARMIFDSRGNPTVEVDLITDLGLFRAAVPSGASTGIHEALELRDEILTDYHGKGVSKAISNINDIIAPELLKKEFDVTQQREIDEFMMELDGTPNLSRFGANAILGISLVVCKAGAAKRGVPLYKHIADLAGNTTLILPVPAFNVINGGSHAGNKLAMQEFMILPTGATSFTEAMKMGSETYHHLKNVIKAKSAVALRMVVLEPYNREPDNITYGCLHIYNTGNSVFWKSPK